MSKINDRIKFVKECFETIPIHNPLKRFKLDAQHIEVRRDPLTGKKSRVCIGRSLRPKQEGGYARELIKILQESKKDCMFCSERVEVSTPKFSEDFISSGRMELGEFVLIPNLFPFGKYHAVGILSKKHITNIAKIESKDFMNCFEGCNNFFRKVNEIDSRFVYPIVSLNFLQPSGASIVHPHVQVLMDKEPYEETQLLMKKSQSYYTKYNRNYWRDLSKLEKNLSLRYIGNSGCVDWVSSFAPRSNNEVTGIVDSGASCIIELNKNEIMDLSLGISKIFRGFSSFGFQSFNMSIYSGPLDRNISDYFLVNLKIISRPNLKVLYTADKGFMEVLHNEAIILTLPEKVAEDLKRNFKKS